MDLVDGGLIIRSSTSTFIAFYLAHERIVISVMDHGRSRQSPLRQQLTDVLHPCIPFWVLPSHGRTYVPMSESGMSDVAEHG